MATTALYDDFYTTAPDGEEVARQPPAYSFFDPNSPRGGRNPRKTPTGLPPLASRSSTEPDDRTGPPGVDVAAFEDAVADSDAAPEPAGYVSLSSSCTSQPEPRGTAVNLEQRYSPAPHGQPPAGFQAPGAHRWAAPLREAMDSRDGMGPQRPVLPDPPAAVSAREPPAPTVEKLEPLHQRQPPSATALVPPASIPRPAAPPASPAPSSDASAPSVEELLQLSADVDAQRSASASSAGSVPSIFARVLPASAPAVVAQGPPNPTTERSPTRHTKASLDRQGAQEAHYTAVLLRHEAQLLQRRIATLEREATAAHAAKVVSEERADAAAAREATWQARCAALEERLGATTATLEAAVAENTALRQAAAKAPSRAVSVQCDPVASAPGAAVRPPEERGPEDGGAEVTPRRPHERPSRLVSPSLPAALEGSSPTEPSPPPALRSADPPVVSAAPVPAPASVPKRPEPPLSSVPPADAPLPRTLGTPPRSQRGSPRADSSSPREGSGERPRPSGTKAKAKAKEKLSVNDLVAELQAVQEAHTARERMLGHRVAIAEVKAVLADRRADAASRSPSSSPQRLLPPATRPDASPGAIPPSAAPPATPERKPTPARTAPSVPAPAAPAARSPATAAGPEAGSLARTLLADLAASRRSRRATPVATHSVSTSATPPAALATPGPMPHGASGGRSQSSVGTATGLPPPTPPTPGTPSEGRYDEYLRSVRSARTVSAAPSAEPHRSGPRGTERGRPPTARHATRDAPQRREVSPPMPHGAFHGFRPSVATAAVHEPRSSSASSATAAVFVPSPEARPRPGPAAQSPTTQREAQVLDGQGRARSVSQGTTVSTRFATPGRDRVAPAVPSWRPADTSRTHSAPSRTPDRGAGWLDTSPARGGRPRGDSPASDESWTYTYDSGTETAHETPPRGAEDSDGQRRTLSPRFPGGGLTSPAVVGPRPAVASPPRPGGVDIGGRFNAPRRSATPASDRFRPR